MTPIRIVVAVGTVLLVALAFIVGYQAGRLDARLDALTKKVGELP